MPGAILLSPRQQFLDAQGRPLAGGSVEIYRAGTTTPATTWQDRFLTTPNQWPVTLDANGSCLIYVDAAFTYKRVVRSALVGGAPGAIQPHEGADNILVGGEAPTISQRTVDLFSGTGAPASYTLSVTPNSKASTSVHVGGTYVPQASYTLVGNIITMTAAAGTNNVEIVTTDLIDYGGVADQVARAADAAIATSHIYPGTFPTLPTTRPDGSAIQEGDRAFYSGDNNEYIRRAGVWVNFEVDAAASAAAAASSAVDAQTAETNAEAAQAGAETAEAGAEAARDAALIQAGVYVDEPTGRAAVANGVAFKVQGSGNVAAYEYRRVDAASSTLIATYPSFAYVDGIDEERLFAAQAAYFERQRLRTKNTNKPRALVLISTGQSNASAYNAPISGSVSANAFMPVAGNYVGAATFPFYASNQAHSPRWDDFATVVPHAEGAVESTLSGAILHLQDIFPRIYAFSAAYGGHAILQLSGAGPRTTLQASVHRLCDQARADGYEPVVAYMFIQGEANMASFGQLNEATYYDYAYYHLHMLQMLAAQAMEQPDYDAPIVIQSPGQMSTAVYSLGIVNALHRLMRDIPNAIDGGGLYMWPLGGDLIHSTGPGFRRRSEYVGWLLRKFFADGMRHLGLRMINAVRTGASITVTFNDEVVADTSVNFGGSVNAANAEYGFEFTYDGTAYVAITGATFQGRNVILTLAADPGAHAGTEQLRLAGQQTNGAGGTWPQGSSGAQIKSATQEGFLSIYDFTTREVVRPAPHYIAVR